jgi:hypothetical protein
MRGSEYCVQTAADSTLTCERELLKVSIAFMYWSVVDKADIKHMEVGVCESCTECVRK